MVEFVSEGSEAEKIRSESRYRETVSVLSGRVVAHVQLGRRSANPDPLSDDLLVPVLYLSAFRTGAIEPPEWRPAFDAWASRMSHPAPVGFIAR